MRRSRWFFLSLLAFVSAFVFGGTTAVGIHEKQNEIHGVIPTTLTITEDSKLVGDVECLQTDNGPCIQFGRLASS